MPLRLRNVRPAHWLLGAIVFLALIVRFLGLHRGMPYIHEWDEPFALGFVIRMLQRGDLNPESFQRPSVYLYLLLPVTYIHYFYLHVRDGLSSPQNIQVFHPQAFGAGVYRWFLTYPWYSNYPSFYVWARAITAVLGAATVFLVYHLGKRAFDGSVGLLAAAFLAIAPGAVYYADTVRPDIPMVLLVVAATLSGFGILHGCGRKEYVLSGLLAGLAISTKENAFWLIFSLGVAHVMNNKRKSFFDMNLRVMGYCTLAGFFLGTPYLLITPNEVIGQMQIQAMAYGGIPSLALIARALPQYLAYMIRPSQGEWFVIPHVGIGMIPAIAATIGLAVGRRVNFRSYLYLISFPIPYMLFMAGQRIFVLRNMMPVLPFAAIFAGVGTMWIWRALVSRALPYQQSWRRAFAGLGIAAILAVPVWDAFTFAWAMGRDTDTRTEATEWLRRNVAQGTRVAFDKELRWFLPDLAGMPFTVLFAARSEPLVWYVRKHIEIAVVGDKNPLRSLPALAAFPRPLYEGTDGDEGGRDIFPVIDPPVFIVKVTSPPLSLSGSASNPR